MKHNKKTPCRECPFLKTSKPGWLGPDKAEDVIRTVIGESEYGCHMDIELSIEEHGAVLSDLGKIAADPEFVEQCAGAILCANKSFKRYREDRLATHQRRLVSMPDDCVLDVWEFRKHHGGGKK